MLDRFLSPQRKWRNAMIGLIGRIAALTMFVVAQIALAEAAALNVYSAIATRGALEELVPQFQKQTGQTLAITWGTAAMLTKRIAAGEPADVAILTRANIDSLKKDGKIEPDTDITLAQSSIAVAIKSGAPKPDISTPEKLKETLLKATAIAYSNPADGGGGIPGGQPVHRRLGDLVGHLIAASSANPRCAELPEFSRGSFSHF
jgi:ABC-type molybdate transport system substrate-binding protein